MLSSKIVLPLIFIAALALVAAPVAYAVNDSLKATQKDDDYDDEELVNVEGEVTAYLYDDWEEYADDEDDVEEDDIDDFRDDLDDDDDENETDDEDDEDNETKRVKAFVIDDEIIVTFGPWWYWEWLGFNWTDFVEVGDNVNVTGDWEVYDEDNNTMVLGAWHISNLTTDEELTIKEEGRPPWAGGPKALGIDPWPLSKLDD